MTNAAEIQDSQDALSADRVDLAAAFRWAVRLNWHEAVANHFSLRLRGSGTQFLLNPRNRHFSRIRASDLQLFDATDPTTMSRDDAPDATAWGLHGSIHRHCPQARCALHLHPPFATVLACLADSTMPPIDQNSAQFFNRVAIDDAYGGLAFEDEGERCAELLSDPAKKVLIMGNHGVMVIGATVADAFHRLYYFERAAETLIRAYMGPGGRCGSYPMPSPKSRLANRTWTADKALATWPSSKLSSILRNPIIETDFSGQTGWKHRSTS